MQSRYNTIEDLLTNESFINFVLRRNAHDVQFWEQYITNHPEKKDLVEEAVQEYRLLFTTLANADLSSQLQQLKNKIEGGEQATVVLLKTANNRRGGFFRKFTYGVAAAVAIVAIAVYLLWPAQRPISPVSDLITYSCRQGERKSFQFPDGTQVVLNAGSEITLNEQYGKATREVFLTGEAFFEVQHNKQVPFIVHTSSMDVKALGTAFNVKSYSGDKTEAVLVRGLIEVTLKNENNRKLVLHPDEKIMWTASRPQKHASIIKPVKKGEDGRLKEVAWTENSLAFDDESFEEIAQQLNRWYNVEIRFESAAIRQYHFTATFKKEKIDQLLNILKASKPFNYRINDQTIVIY